MVFHFILLPCIIFVATAFGMFGNLSLIYAVLKYRTIRSKHGILLSFLCFYESIGLAYESLNGIQMITHTSVMERSTCFDYLFPYIFTITVQATLMVALALDVLISMAVPIAHRIMNETVYIILLHIPCVAISLYFVISATLHMNDEMIIVCNPPLALPARESKIWNYTTMATNVAVLFIYVLVALLLIKRSKNSSLNGLKTQPKHFKRILRSTLTINAISVVCWFIGAAISRFPFEVDVKTSELIHTYAVIPPLIIMSQNYYVYFLMSTEYCFVFLRMLRFGRIGTMQPLRSTNVS